MSREKPRPDPHHHTKPAASDDARTARELGAGENADLCAGCVRCCTYITIQVDPPRAAWEYDQWLWALHHEGIEMYIEQPEAWYVHVETRCRQLNAEGRCGIHGRHPVLCREYDPRSCERRLPLAEIRAWFKNAEALEAWLRRERPAHWARLESYRRLEPAGEPVASGWSAPSRGAPAFVSLTSLEASARRRAPLAAPAGRSVRRPSAPSRRSGG